MRIELKPTNSVTGVRLVWFSFPSFPCVMQVVRLRLSDLHNFAPSVREQGPERTSERSRMV